LERIETLIAECRAQTKQIGTLQAWIEGLLRKPNGNDGRAVIGEAGILLAPARLAAIEDLKDCDLPSCIAWSRTLLAAEYRPVSRRLPSSFLERKRI